MSVTWYDVQHNLGLEHAPPVTDTVFWATLLGINIVTLHRWIKDGRFPRPIISMTRKRLFATREVLEWLAAEQNAQAHDNGEVKQ